jgi:hypothetical protein
MTIAASGSGSVILAVREVRMIVERLLLTTGMSAGFVPAVRDSILYSQAQGLGGLAALAECLETLRAAQPSAVTIATETARELVIDAGHQHSWIAAPSVLDLALDRFREGHVGPLLVRNLAAAEELAIVSGLAGRHGARATVSRTDGACVIRIVADGQSEPDAVLAEALRTGFAVPRTLWHTLYEQSKQALAPDSIASRRHAGPVMVDADGRIHGRDDDETDFSMLGLETA